MGFCGVMDNCIRLRYELVGEFTVCNIANHQLKAGFIKPRKGSRVRGVRHFVENCDSVLSALQQVMNKV